MQVRNTEDQRIIKSELEKEARKGNSPSTTLVSFVFSN